MRRLQRPILHDTILDEFLEMAFLNFFSSLKIRRELFSKLPSQAQFNGDDVLS